jgi:hypothetical protein
MAGKVLNFKVYSPLIQIAIGSVAVDRKGTPQSANTHKIFRYNQNRATKIFILIIHQDITSLWFY